VKIYLVGGAVRDALLGLPVRDRDWMVVGAHVHELESLGYVRVGRDFPVFLHPQSHEEYALARTERKSAPGYQGFVVHADPGVTLEQDLARRDLSINAMAVPLECLGPDTQFSADQVIDPFHGRADLAARVLRHAGPAFVEDPVRLLRLARFAARFADFQVAPGTMELAQQMVQQGEVDHLVPERVWQELARGLMEPRPTRLFDVLHACGALARLLPELLTEGAVAPFALQALDAAAQRDASLELRFACLFVTPDAHIPAAVLARREALLHALLQRLKVPLACSELAALLTRDHASMLHVSAWDAESLLQLLERCDALRKPARFESALQVCSFAAGALPPEMRARTEGLRHALRQVLAAPVQAAAAHAVASGLSGPEVGAAQRRVRLAALEYLHAAPGGDGRAQ